VSPSRASSERLVNTIALAALAVLAAGSCGLREAPLPQRAAMNKAARATAVDLAGCDGVQWAPPLEPLVPADLELTLEYVRRPPNAPARIHPPGQRSMWFAGVRSGTACGA
jgi:hypothetical protein